MANTSTTYPIHTIPIEIRDKIWEDHLDNLPPTRHVFAPTQNGIMYGARKQNGPYKNITIEGDKEKPTLWIDPDFKPPFVGRIHFPGKVYVATGEHHEQNGFWDEHQLGRCEELSSVSILINFNNDYIYLGAKDPVPDRLVLNRPPVDVVHHFSASTRSSPDERSQPLPDNHWLFKVRNLVLKPTDCRHRGSMLDEIDRDMFERHEALEQVLIVCDYDIPKSGCGAHELVHNEETGFMSVDAFRKWHARAKDENNVVIDECFISEDHPTSSLASAIREIFEKRKRPVDVRVVVDTTTRKSESQVRLTVLMWEGVIEEISDYSDEEDGDAEDHANEVDRN